MDRNWSIPEERLRTSKVHELIVRLDRSERLQQYLATYEDLVGRALKNGSNGVKKGKGAQAGALA